MLVRPALIKQHMLRPSPLTFSHAPVLLLLPQDHFLNAANWMWLSASAFFNQYYRVYSPVTFGKKYDPEGRFIRRFVPQLAQFPSKYIYEPHMAPREVQQRSAAGAGGCLAASICALWLTAARAH